MLSRVNSQQICSTYCGRKLFVTVFLSGRTGKVKVRSLKNVLTALACSSLEEKYTRKFSYDMLKYK